MIDTGRLIHRAVDVEAGLTQIRVHELASELSVSTQQVVAFVEELGKKVRGPSTVIGVSIAAKVRSRFRAARGVDAVTLPPAAAGPDAAPTTTTTPTPAATAPAAAAGATTAPAAPAPRHTVGSGQSLFLPPVAPAAAAAFSAGPVTFANPFAVPEARQAARPSRPPVPPAERVAAQRLPPAAPPLVADPVQNFDDAWRHRGFDRDEQEVWCSNGIRPQDAALADQCRLMGIAPEDLPRKLSGRTVLQRLRDGESTTSVWARIQEADQAPRRAGTKLTGRFQLS